MTSIPEENQMDAEAFNQLSREQYQAVVAAAAEDGVTLQSQPNEGAPDAAWQAGHILVSGDVNHETNDFLRELGAELAPTLDGDDQDVRVDRPKLLKINSKFTTQDAVKFLNIVPELKGKVALNNLLSMCPVALCPADEPRPVRPYPETIPYPPPSTDPHDDAGHDVTVSLIDVGLTPGWKDGHPWLYDANRNPPTDVGGDPYPSPNGQIERYAGHSVFGAGVMRCVAPRVTVNVSNALRWAGSMAESEVGRIINEQLDTSPQPQIICLPAGCTTVDGTPPMTIVNMLARLRTPGCETLLIAAAGNDGKGPGSGAIGTFYPAALADPGSFENMIVAVGALREDRLGRACFTNYNTWVSVYDDGERLINAFPIGDYTYREPLSKDNPTECVYYQPRIEVGCTCVTAQPQGTTVSFNGMAKWSGTSFSVAVVTGRVARYLTEHAATVHGNPRQAWAEMKNELTTIPDASGVGNSLRIFKTPAGG